MPGRRRDIVRTESNECDERFKIKKLRETQQHLLGEFIRICDELGLQYFAVQGTLLGTVRHGGSIPWDDDIDVGMFRKDYEAFLNKAPALLPKYCFLQTFHTDPQYYHCFAKLRDSRTTFIENTAQKLQKMNQGIFIDIFPFDYYPEKLLAARLFDIRKFILRYRLRSEFYIPQDNIRSVSNGLRKFLMYTAKKVCPSERRALQESEDLFVSVGPGRLLINNGSPWGRREIVEKSWMEKTILHKYENLLINIPAGYDNYLRRVYGDYMKLPPENERRPHHYAKMIDPFRPYTQWMAVFAKEQESQ